jgi:hypothetical protein
MPRRLHALLLCLLLAGCSDGAPIKAGDELVAKSTGSVFGKVVQVEVHTYPSGTSGRSALVELSSTHEQRWFTVDTLTAGYQVKP